MSHPHAPGLDARGIHKSYGTHEVLRGVDLRVEPGQVLGLLGRNGAGKSTLITILCGLRRADSGTASICGHRPTSAQAAREAASRRPSPCSSPKAARFWATLRSG